MVITIAIPTVTTTLSAVIIFTIILMLTYHDFWNLLIKEAQNLLQRKVVSFHHDLSSTLF